MHTNLVSNVTGMLVRIGVTILKKPCFSLMNVKDSQGCRLQYRHFSPSNERDTLELLSVDENRVP